ncbi:dipeptide ABC transporter ATP-binding protein [Roseomonas marmotae]|uniref:ABC transporter ATP-binding protein n=1 Tax=Roseomonas marmotae TaxID=2768161 RepID=A0ABS3K7K3_9PROT|nr:ABC transporter ATP-binding protein [Roseomonas marmotae]MBO1073453.1 ABC transporter ATP-binding protein [Roseomonas marmotae]QTI80351.1 ABC transporter ATP-binding protein [Roseomonas marmotae]
MSVPLLSVQELSVEFRTRSGTVRALEHVSFDLLPGEMLGIVGESGSGKSVTALAVTGLLHAAARITGGRALFGGQDLLRLGQGALNRLRGAEMSIVFQDPRAALNPIRPVGQQIADVIARHDPGPAAAIRERMLATLRQMRIPDPERRAGAFPFELSGGMCQRIGIAMALACSPRLLIADEPTTGLDVTTQATIMDLFRDAVRARGAGSVLITHDLALASEYCDRILVMHAGQVVEDAPVAGLFAHPRHPYTVGLLRSVPSSVESIDALMPVGGSPPDLRRAALPLQRALRAPPAPLRCPRPAPGSRCARPPRGLPPAMGGTAAVSAPVLDARGLRKAFALSGGWRLFRPVHRPRIVAVDGVDLTIHPGEAVGLVGESGCGKSTLARLISRLIEPDEGELLLDGQPIHPIRPGAFAASPQRRRIQMVFQDPAESLNPRFSVFDAIADPAKQLLPGEGRATLRARVEHAADQVGLPRELFPRYPHQLSGGQKARVGIARAMVVEPRLLVLDEPTGALDVSVQAVVLKLLARLRRQEGVAQLFVSHDLDVVRLLCDRVLVMYLGKVVESGPAGQIFHAPRHPYTRALLSAIPRLPGQPRGTPERLPGEPRSPVDPDPRACRLHGRCPRGTDFCATHPPELREVAPGQMARCHFPLEADEPA